MGIIHLAPVGRSPGAVTSPLVHLKRVYDQQEKDEARLPHSVLPRSLGYPVEAIVLFMSDEVYRGVKDATALETIYNQFGNREPIRRFLEQDNCSVRDLIAEFAARELSNGKLVIYARRVDVDDFQACFRLIAETVLALGRPDDLGKTLWANLTGGTNVLNAALLEVTFLSGLIDALYYIFANESEKSFMQPMSSDYKRYLDYHWRNIPAMKTTFDERYHLLLAQLIEATKAVDSEQLLFDLQAQHPAAFGAMSPELFQKQWLRKMGREIELGPAPDGRGRLAQITEAGLEMAYLLKEPLFQTLVRRGEMPQVDLEALRQALEKDRLE